MNNEEMNMDINNLNNNHNYRVDIHNKYYHVNNWDEFPDLKGNGFFSANYSVVKCEFKIARYALRWAYHDVFNKDIEREASFNPCKINDDPFISAREQFNKYYDYLVKQFKNPDKLEIYQNDLTYLLKQRRFEFLDSKENQIALSFPTAVNDNCIENYKTKFNEFIKLHNTIHTNNYVELVNNTSIREIMESLIISEIELCNSARKKAYLDASKVVVLDNETKPCRFNHYDIFIDPKKLYYRVYDFYLQQLWGGGIPIKVYKKDIPYLFYKQRFLHHDNGKNLCGDNYENKVINYNQSYI